MTNRGQRAATRRLGGVAALAVAAMPALLSGMRAVTGKWTAVIDNGVISVKATDTWNGHPPLVGIYTSLSAAAQWPHHLYHPGPIEFWVFAPVQRLFGPDAIGLAIAAAVVNAAAAAGVVWVARRVGGPTLGWGAALVVVVLCWSLGGQVLHDPWNPHLAVVPCLFVLAVAWAVAAGDARLLPLYIVAGSVVMELHLTFVLPVLAVGLVAVVGLVTAIRRDGTAPGTRSWRRWVLGSVVAALAVWSGPIIDQVAGSGNLWGLARASSVGGTARIGLGGALRGLVHATSLPPTWWTRTDDLVRPQGGVTVVQVITAVVLLTTVLALTVRAWRARRRAVLAAVGVAGAGLLGAVITVARTPAGFGYEELLWARRVWWPVGAFVWIAAGAALGAELAERGGAPLLGWLRPRSRHVTWPAAILAAGLIIVAWPDLGVAHDYGSAGFGPVRTLGPSAARAASAEGPWVVSARGEFATFVVGPGVVAELAARGVDVRVPSALNLDLGSHHRVPAASRPTGSILVVSGTAARVPGGYRQVAAWDPASSSAPYRSYRTTMFLVPIEPVRVFVRGPGES